MREPKNLNPENLVFEAVSAHVESEGIAVYLAVAGLLLCSGLAKAADVQTPKLSFDPVVLTADDATPPAPLQGLLDKAGVGQSLSSAGIQIYGWIESGYSYDHRHHGGGNADLGGSGSSSPSLEIVPGPFNTEVGNHYMLNQVALRVERDVDPTKFDIGGMIDLDYGTDASITHSTGLSFGGVDPSSTGSYVQGKKYQALPGFDVTQAFIDVNVPVLKGLKFRVGKFVTLLGYETIDPRGNPLYSHSYIFNALPFTQTGVLGVLTLNDQWTIQAGITRGWDQSLEDSGPNGGLCAIDGTGEFSWSPNSNFTANLAWNVGPENFGDTSHYRTVIDPTMIWHVTDKFSVGAEAVYIYDGGFNGNAFATPPVTHAYGDIWGADLYLGYKLNDYVTLNSRLEKYHTSVDGNDGAVAALPGGSLNIYSVTVGTTITPLPNDPIGKNLSLRPEIRYDFTDSGRDQPFTNNTNSSPFKDQLTFAADVIFKF